MSGILYGAPAFFAPPGCADGAWAGAGVDLVMYGMTLRQLARRRAAGGGYKFFLAFSTALMLLLTIDISVNAVWGEFMWINARDEPGGVPVFIATQLSNWYQAWGSSAAVGLVLLSDALLVSGRDWGLGVECTQRRVQIYRLFIIYGSNYYIIIFPILVYLGATGKPARCLTLPHADAAPLALAILELVTSFTPGGFFFGAQSVNFGTPYYAMTIGLNILVTALICARLLALSRAVRATMGAENARLYTGVAAILVESAAPYSLVGIVFLVPYARGSLVSVALGQVWAKLTVRAPPPLSSFVPRLTCLCAVHRAAAHHPARRVRPGVVQGHDHAGAHRRVRLLRQERRQRARQRRGQRAGALRRAVRAGAPRDARQHARERRRREREEGAEHGGGGSARVGKGDVSWCVSWCTRVILSLFATTIFYAILVALQFVRCMCSNRARFIPSLVYTPSVLLHVYV